MMNMSPTPAQMTPAMAELGNAILQAVTLIVANPDAAAFAEKARAGQAMLTDDQVKAYNDALLAIDQAAQLDSDFEAREAAVKARESQLASDRKNLYDDLARYNNDTLQLSLQQQRCAEREAKVQKREDEMDDRDTEAARIDEKQAQTAARLDALDKALKKREDKLNAITQAAQGDDPA